MLPESGGKVRVALKFYVGRRREEAGIRGGARGWVSGMRKRKGEEK